MSFYIYCESCGQKLEAENEHIGNTLPCPSCGKDINVSKVSPLKLVKEKYIEEDNIEYNNPKKASSYSSKGFVWPWIVSLMCFILCISFSGAANESARGFQRVSDQQRYMNSDEYQAQSFVESFIRVGFFNDWGKVTEDYNQARDLDSKASLFESNVSFYSLISLLFGLLSAIFAGIGILKIYLNKKNQPSTRLVDLLAPLNALLNYLYSKMRVVDHYIDSKIFSINYFSFPFRIWVLGFIFSVIGIGFPIIGILLSLFPFWLYAVSKNMVWLKMIKHKVINKTLISSLCKRFVFNLSYPPTLIGIVGVIYIIVSITVELFSGARISYILNSSEHFGIKIFIFTPFIAASLIKTLVNATEDEVLV